MSSEHINEAAKVQFPKEIVMSPGKSMSWNSVKKLTVVSLGVLLALGEVTAQAEQYEAIYRPWQNADQEARTTP